MKREETCGNCAKSEDRGKGTLVCTAQEKTVMESGRPTADFKWNCRMYGERKRGGIIRPEGDDK